MVLYVTILFSFSFKTNSKDKLTMSPLDAITVIILSLFLVRGIWTGFIKQVASIAALIIGFVVAGRFYGESSRLVIPFIDNQQAGFFIAYILLFLVSFAAVIFLGVLLKKVVTLSLLGWFDGLLGGMVGLIKGVFISCLLFMILASFISGGSPFFTKSFFYPYLESTSKLLVATIKDQDLRKGLIPQKPAISNFLSETIELGKKLGGQTEQKTGNH